MQITFSADQIAWVRTAVGTLSTILTLFGIIVKGKKWLLEKLSEFITLNVNRNRDETVAATNKYVDQKFEDHEINAFSRLEAQELQISELKKEIEKINKMLQGSGR